MPGTHVAVRTRTERAGDANEVKVLSGHGTGPNLLLRHATQPEERWEEVDQTDPAGRYRSYVNGDVWYFQRALTASWATATTLWQADANGVTFAIPQTFTINDATNNDVTAVLTLNHNTTGSPATGLGTRMVFGIETSTTVSTTAGLIDVLWTTVTHATRTSDMVLSVVVSAVTTEHLRLDGSANQLQASRPVYITVAAAGLQVEHTSDAASVQVAIFEGNRATPADNDAAYISLRISDSAGNQDEGARITWQATTVLSGATQDTDLILSALVNNALTTFVTLDGSASEVVIGQVLSLGDDIAVTLGTGGTVRLIYETADADANALLFVAPEGGATDVPMFIFGDASILNVDLTWFAGITEPTLAVVNDAGDAYATLDAGDDAVAASKGLYFRAAADEDIELINLSVTGTPRFYWDESEDQFRFAKGVVFDAACDVQGVWVATATWTLPAITLGGQVDANSQNIINMGDIKGPVAAGLNIFAKFEGIANVLGFYTPGVAPGYAETIRLAIAGGAATVVATWSAVTHTGLVLSGEVACGDQAFTNVGDMTFATGSIIASGSTNGNTLLLRANDTTFVTFTTGATDVCTMAAITMSGTWLASGTVTLPAFTAGGDITLGAYFLRTTNILLKEGAATRFDIRNAADSAFLDLGILSLEFSGAIYPAAATGLKIRTTGADNANLIFDAMDNGVGTIEVGRLQGAADPYWQIGHFRLNPVATASLPAAPVEGMLYYDDTVNKLKIYNGAAWETVTSAA